MQALEQGESSQDSLNIFNITTGGYNELLVVGITLDQLYILEGYKKGMDYTLQINSSKIQANRQTLIRKGYLSEINTVTTTGAALLSATIKKKPIAIELENAYQTAAWGFEEWWKTYPATDIFEHKGVKFNGNRAMRVKKDDCRKKFSTVLAEGQYTVSDMIKALKYEVYLKKEDSVRLRENKLKYMVNSLSYLNQRVFEGFIEIAKSIEIKEETHSESDNCDI